MIHSYQKPLNGKNIGVVFGSFAPLHQGHLDLIMKAKKENDGGAIVIVCGYDGDKGEPLMPHAKRYRYVREFFADDDLVAVYSINDSELGIENYPYGWEKWLEEFYNIYRKAVCLRYQFEDDPPHLRLMDKYPKCTWYVGDENYYNDLIERKQNAVLVDRVANNPICATMIRNNPIKHWDKIAAPFRRVFSHNILVTGTASEGKSTLVTDLGKYFNAPHSYEWARGYMEQSCVSDWELDGADFMAFLEGQYNLNKELINSPGNHGVFFADTDALVTKMYAEHYAEDDSCAMTMDEYTRVAAMADELARKSRWDKIFCLVPKNTFVDDHTRFMNHSDMDSRNELLSKLIKHLEDANLMDKVVFLDGGDYYNNFMTIVNYVNEVMAR